MRISAILTILGGGVCAGTNMFLGGQTRKTKIETRGTDYGRITYVNVYSTMFEHMHSRIIVDDVMQTFKHTHKNIERIITNKNILDILIQPIRGCAKASLISLIIIR